MDKLVIINIVLMGSVLIVSDSPVAAVLAVIAIFASVSALLALNGFGTLALFILIIYIGAIAILFLFITFLLNLRKIEPEAGINRTIRYGLATITTLGMVSFLVSNTLKSYPQKSEVGSLIEDQGNLSVYTSLYESLTFWIIGLLLLVAMIGVILLTKTPKDKRGASSQVLSF